MDYYLLIEDYLKDRLPKQEKLAFEQELKNNPRLQRALDNFDLVETISSNLIDDEVAGVLEKLESKAVIRSTSNIYSMARKLASYAAVVLIASGICLVFYANQNYSDTALIQQLYVDSTLDGTRSAELDTSSGLEKALFLYRTKQFSELQAFVLELEEAGDGSVPDQIYVLQGDAQLLQKHYEEALSTYSKIENSKLAVNKELTSLLLDRNSIANPDTRLRAKFKSLFRRIALCFN